MFENFSFDSPRSPSIESSTAGTRDSSRSVSPFSPSAPFPPPRYSMTDLSAEFAGQRIRRESPICYDSCEAYANNDDDDAGWAIPPIDDADCRTLSRSRTFPQRPHSPSRRAQRQLNTRLLCSASHHRDIAGLVSRMVDSNEQCSIAPSGSLSPTRVEQEDEGYSSGNEPAVPSSRRSSVATIRSRPEFRRSSDYKSGGIAVSKNIRLRKNDNTRRKPSSRKAS